MKNVKAGLGTASKLPVARAPETGTFSQWEGQKDTCHVK